MNDKNSLIEYYRRQVVERINTETYKAVVFDPVTGKPIKVGDKIKKESKLIVPKWTECMKTHIKTIPGSSSKNMAEQIFDLGEALRDVFIVPRTRVWKQTGLKADYLMQENIGKNW